MKPAGFPELLHEASSGVVRYELLSQIAKDCVAAAPEILDTLSIYVAQAYADGEMSFEDGDRVMNAVFSVAVSEQFWAEHNSTVPPIMLEVYQAFDAGEYFHDGDEAGVDLELKYTRPLIEKLLAEQSRDAQPFAAADGFAAS